MTLKNVCVRMDRVYFAPSTRRGLTQTPYEFCKPIYEQMEPINLSGEAVSDAVRSLLRPPDAVVENTSPSNFISP